MKQQLIDDLRKQGYSRIADLLAAEQDAPSVGIAIAPGVIAYNVPPATHEHDWIVDAPVKKKAK